MVNSFFSNSAMQERCSNNETTQVFVDLKIDFPFLSFFLSFFLCAERGGGRGEREKLIATIIFGFDCCNAHLLS